MIIECDPSELEEAIVMILGKEGPSLFNIDSMITGRFPQRAYGQYGHSLYGFTLSKDRSPVRIMAKKVVSALQESKRVFVPRFLEETSSGYPVSEGERVLVVNPNDIQLPLSCQESGARVTMVNPNLFPGLNLPKKVAENIVKEYYRQTRGNVPRTLRYVYSTLDDARLKKGYYDQAYLFINDKRLIALGSQAATQALTSTLDYLMGRLRGPDRTLVIVTQIDDPLISYLYDSEVFRNPHKKGKKDRGTTVIVYKPYSEKVSPIDFPLYDSMPARS